MREAVAFDQRIEFSLVDEPEAVTVGLRDNGLISIYFGSDPVFHFDDNDRLRRAFLGGDLYRTQGKTLARLTRRRSAAATELLRYDLTGDELLEFLGAMNARLKRFRDAVAQRKATVVRRICDDEFVPALLTRIDDILNLDEQLAPQIAGKS